MLQKTPGTKKIAGRCKQQKKNFQIILIKNILMYIQTCNTKELGINTSINVCYFYWIYSNATYRDFEIQEWENEAIIFYRSK